MRPWVGVWAYRAVTIRATIAVTIKFFVMRTSNKSQPPRTGRNRGPAAPPCPLWLGFLLRQGDHVDFHQDILRQASDLHGRARGWPRAEVFAVNLVHGGKVADVLQENAAADHPAQAALSRLQNLREIPQDAVRLCFNVADDNLLGRGIDGDLSRDEDKSVRSNGLRVRADGLRGVFCKNNFAHRDSSRFQKKLNHEGTEYHRGKAEIGAYQWHAAEDALRVFTEN